MTRRASRRAAALVAALAVSSAASASAGAAPVFDGPTIKEPAVAPDFVLRDQDGKLVQLSRLRGKAVALTFLYTHCPDACPLTAERLSDAVLGLGRERARVRVLAVSVDPKGDTPRVVARFVRVHRLVPEFRYLTGAGPVLRAVWSAYGVQSVRQAGNGIDHTLFTLLIDPRGRGRVLDDSTAKTAALRHDLRLLLAGA